MKRFIFTNLVIIFQFTSVFATSTDVLRLIDQQINQNPDFQGRSAIHKFFSGRSSRNIVSVQDQLCENLQPREIIEVFTRNFQTEFLNELARNDIRVSEIQVSQEYRGTTGFHHPSRSVINDHFNGALGDFNPYMRATTFYRLRIKTVEGVWLRTQLLTGRPSSGFSRIFEDARFVYSEGLGISYYSTSYDRHDHLGRFIHRESRCSIAPTLNLIYVYNEDTGQIVFQIGPRYSNIRDVSFL